jgi:hypothetical protein
MEMHALCGQYRNLNYTATLAEGAYVPNICCSREARI